MPVPLYIDSASLARAAGRITPRLASILMATHQGGAPLTSESHPTGGPAALGTLLVGENPLAGWVRRALAAEVAMVRPTPKVQLAPVSRPNAPVPRTLLSPISDIYKRLRAESGGMDRAKTADELLESARPAPAGQSSVVAEKSMLIPASSRTDELALLAASVIRYCFGDDARRAGGGALDISLFSNLGAASNVISPGKLPSEMSRTEILAIVTAGVHSTNSVFLRQLRSIPGVPLQALEQPVSMVPAGDKVATQFLKDGKFDPETFKSKTQGAVLDGLKLGAMSPAAIKIGLLAVAAQKAVQIVDELPARRGSLLDLADSIRSTVHARFETEDDQSRPSLRPQFDRPTAPGA